MRVCVCACVCVYVSVGGGGVRDVVVCGWGGVGVGGEV